MKLLTENKKDTKADKRQVETTVVVVVADDDDDDDDNLVGGRHQFTARCTMLRVVV